MVAYDYASDRAVDACVDLDAGVVAHLEFDKSQPMLSRDEEAVAVSIAMVDERVRAKLAMGDMPQATFHYWGRTPADIAYGRRSAAVVVRPQRRSRVADRGGRPRRQTVTQVVPAEQW